MEREDAQSTPSPTNAGSGRRRRKRWEKDQILSEIEIQNRQRDQEKGPRRHFLRELGSALKYRVFQFVVFYLAVSLFLYAQEDKDKKSGVASLNDMYPLEILSFAAAVFSINTVATCLDYMIFYVLETSWTGHYDVVYYARSIHGVLGHIISLIVVVNVLTPMHVMQKLGSLHAFTTSCLVVALCHILKEYYLRRHHNGLLKIRLKHKLAQMGEWSHILSTLGLYNPLVDDESDTVINDSDTTAIFNPVFHRNENHLRYLSGGSNVAPGSYMESALQHKPSTSVEFPPIAHPSHHGQNQSVKSEAFSRTHPASTLNCMCCCNDDESDNFCSFCLFGKVMERDGAHSTLTSDDADISTHFDEDTQESKASLNFWTQLDMLRNGHLHVYSRFGFTAIRSRKQAEAFGNKLYMHLTNGNTIPFTSSTICEAMRHQLSSENTRCESLPYTCHPLTPDRFNNVDKGDMTDVVCHALRLFRCSESNSGLNSDVPVTQSTVVNAVVTVFKEIQFSRASLQDLKNLHESAKSVLDFIFYLFLLLLVQVILNVDISKILAPLLTILFGLSFAFSPVLSNLFLSMSFVMFLLPFNVGNRVIIGKTEKIMGNIFEMSLMHTTILTRHNEKLRIPNHQLFHEHITNLSDGMVSTFEISLVFALDGPLKCPQDKIHAFIRKIKNFAKEDNKSDWIDVIVFCDDINFGNNQATYTFWCTHRAGYHEVIRCYNGLTKMLEEMRRVQVELDIHFQKGLKLL